MLSSALISKQEQAKQALGMWRHLGMITKQSCSWHRVIRGELAGAGSCVQQQ